MKKLMISTVVIVQLVFSLNTQIHAGAVVDAEGLKEEIKQDLRAERPWLDEIRSWKIDIHGFVSQGYLYTNHNNFLANDSKGGSFKFNEIGINFNKNVSDRLRVGVQFFARDLGEIGNDKVTVDWALADYRWKDWLGLRAGKIKAPHGLYNEERDIDSVRTFILLPQSIYSEANREAQASVQGAGLYGNAAYDFLGEFNYQLLAGTCDVDKDSGPAVQFNSNFTLVNPLTGELEPTWEVSDDFDMGKMYIASLQWNTPLIGLLFKGTIRKTSMTIPARTGNNFIMSYYMGIPEGRAVEVEIQRYITIVGSVEYTWGDLILAAELQDMKLNYQVNIDSYPYNPFADATVNQQGYYVSAAYRFYDWLEMGAYYSKLYEDSDDKNGKEAEGVIIKYDYQYWLEDIALSLRFDINENWLVKVEGHLMDGVALVPRQYNDDFEKDWFLGAIKITYSF